MPPGVYTLFVSTFKVDELSGPGMDPHKFVVKVYSDKRLRVPAGTPPETLVEIPRTVPAT